MSTKPELRPRLREVYHYLSDDDLGRPFARLAYDRTTQESWWERRTHGQWEHVADPDIVTGLERMAFDDPDFPDYALEEQDNHQ